MVPIHSQVVERLNVLPAEVHTSQIPAHMLTKVVMMEKLKSCSAFVVFNTEYLSLSRSESFLVEREREIRATAVSTIVSKWEIVKVVVSDCRT